MNPQELEYFDHLNKKFETTASSTEEMKQMIKEAGELLKEQENQLKQEFASKRMYLAEVERIISNIEKGTLRK